MNIKKVGVVGAGQMGNGIAHVVALAGYDVVLHDIDPARIDEALATINGNLSRQVAKDKISKADMDKALKRIGKAEKLDALADVDLAI
ncbi:MAG: 3-hydroxyacyl-CoA dehydrogenase NAD-binding domain-containing protein, partial [Methyloligellaceae bacterium]